MDIYQLIGKRIREGRIKAKLTLAELAEEAAISESFLAYLERGQRKASLATIKKLADGLGIAVASLFSTVPLGTTARDPKTSRKVEVLLRGRKPSDQALMIDILKTVGKTLGRRR